MQLNEQQLEAFERDGFLIFPQLLSADEIAALRAETDRLRQLDCEYVTRERNGAMRTIFRVHEDNGPTQSPAFRALTRTPRMLGSAMQLLGDDRLYIFHTKINLKPAIEGTIWAWHQDYGTWQKDGVPKPTMLTYAVMLDEAEEMGGALYLVPGSHKQGTLEHTEDLAVGALNQYSVRRDLLVDALEARKAVSVSGAAGTVVVFDCNVVHGSGHNMSPRDRRQLYVVYNPAINAPAPSARLRGDHRSSENHAPIELGPDNGILLAAARAPARLEKV
jgi:ectoine hydroxylase